MTAQINPEFSRIVPLDKVGQSPLNYHIQAEEDERKALTDRFKIVGIQQLDADFVIRKGRQENSFEIDGLVQAIVVQSCVVTLEDVIDSLKFPIRLILKEYGQDELHDPEDDLNLDDDADIEDLKEDSIDLGEITAQYLSLALDPYPRSSKALEAPEAVDNAPKPSPFDILKKLKT